MLPIHVAKKLLLLVEQTRLPASMCKHVLFNEMVHDGILQKQMQGRSKSYYALTSQPLLQAYLQNRFGLSNLQQYILTLDGQQSSRADAVQASSNTKIKRIRSFTGFLVACLHPVRATLNGQPFIIPATAGAFTYISDYTNFFIPGNVTVVGVENAANFNNLDAQAYLFKDIEPLFVCRYPHSSDLIKWLQAIPNKYLHFGDIDFAGIHIFLNEYYKTLDNRASFLVPPRIEELLPMHGNRQLYNNHLPVKLVPDHELYDTLQPVIELIHQNKKGLEQEIFIGRTGLLKEGEEG